MITRIEIDGFKTFQDFAVDLAPFQVIIGANGCGKSNFFDALDLISKLATSDLRAAFKGIRGDINELFTVLPNNKSADKMRFAVEMLVEDVAQVQANDEFARVLSRMRYEVELGRRIDTNGFEQLYVVSECSSGISNADDEWRKSYLTRLESALLPTAERDIYHVPDVNPQGIIQTWTHLNAMGDLTPASWAVQRELKALRLLRLDTNTLRKSSSYFDEPVLTMTGENLPATLARMQTQDKHLLKDVSRDVFNIVPNFAGIEVDRDEGRKRIALYATMRDKRRLSINALSEGTLRILALATLRNDPQLQGTLCFEDPETGVHPGALKRMVKMLRSMATNLDDPEDMNMPLRQILVTTHSPELVSELNIEGGELLFAVMPTHVVPQGASWQVTRFFPVCSGGANRQEQAYALSSVIQYLNNPESAKKPDRLREVIVR